MKYEQVLEAAAQLGPIEQLRLGTVLRARATVELDIEWDGPFAFEAVGSLLPRVPGVYAIVLVTASGVQLARLGATRDASRRPANYRPEPFREEPRLRVAFCAIPHAFARGMTTLLETAYAKHTLDLDWLEYRMERCLLDAYERRWRGLPPGNFQRGSRRPYMDHIVPDERGELRVLELPPAELSEQVLRGLRQSRPSPAVARAPEGSR